MNIPIPRYYGQDLWPKSPLLDTPEFQGSQLDYLLGISQNAIHIRKLDAVYGYIPDASFAWRILDCIPVPDEDVMSYFRTFRVAVENMQIVNLVSDTSVIGVVNGGKQSLAGSFRFKPIDTTGFYMAYKNEFMTQATSHYQAMVLDYRYPTEAMSFGRVEVEHDHQGLIITFGLMPLDPETYPYDYPAANPG